MNRIHIFLVLFLISIIPNSLAQTKKSDANLVGHVVSHGEHIPFATISIKGTTIGIMADDTGHFQLVNLPEGELTVIARSLGFKPQEKTITIKAGETIELNFELNQDLLGLEEVVVTGDRNATNRKKSSTIVTTLTSKMLANTQSITLSEGLNSIPGLRTENNCQNCGFTQVRMNGMEGPYSQILINSLLSLVV